MKKKLSLIIFGYILTGCNLALIGTRLNTLGLLFGLLGGICFIKALLIKK